MRRSNPYAYLWCFTCVLRPWIDNLGFALLGLGLSLASVGCATAPSVYGNRARFSPAFQGYVMAKSNGSDDPDTRETVLLLRDPLTGTKLRCQKDVVAWRELYEDLADDQVQDRNAAVAATVTTVSLFAPLLAVHPMGGLILAEAMMTGDSLYADLRSDTPKHLLARAIKLYRRKRYLQASTMIERALAKDVSVGTLDKAYYYLGFAYRQQGNVARARLALSMFIDRAAIRDVDAYREAEAALGALGVHRAPCASTDSVELAW
jgi:tetratricopeptide (TPR) repeat protein